MFLTHRTKSFYQNLIFVFEGTPGDNLYYNCLIYRIKECLVEDNLCPWMKYDYLNYYKTTVEVNNSSFGNRPGM